MSLYLDANVFVLALAEDEKGEIARKWLERVQEGREDAVVSTLALDEIMWVLMRAGKSHLVEDVVRQVYSLRNCVVVGVDSAVPLAALGLIKKYSLKPRDAFHVAVMQEHKLKTIVSDDRDFDRVHEIKRRF